MEAEKFQGELVDGYSSGILIVAFGVWQATSPIVPAVVLESVISVRVS